MIKSLLDADENPPPETKVIIEETTVEQPTANTRLNTVFSPEQMAEAEDILEIPTAVNRVNTNIESGADTTNNAPQISAASTGSANFQFAGETSKPEDVNFVLPPVGSETARTTEEPTIFQAEHEPESTAETMRKSGLAYAAAITLFGAVVFMMILGWGADWLLGSSPWGIVGGIVLGAIIGFVQLFRLSSQIIKNKG